MRGKFFRCLWERPPLKIFVICSVSTVRNERGEGKRMETNSLVVTDSNVQALANALCMFAEKMGELSRQYPVYPDSLMGTLQQLEDKMQALELQMQRASEFWRRPWSVLPKSLQKFGKMRMWTHCCYRLQQQCKAFGHFANAA